MAWADIDFDTIVAGAVTNDVNSEQNFNFVLNEFGIALDERLNIVTTSATNPPVLPAIRFFVDGEIRAGNTFMDKYRELLDGYFNLWNDFTWYDPAALDDPLNFITYTLEDIDLEVAMGINAYDLLINRDDKNRVELWSADLLNGLYELYKLTRVQRKGVIILLNSTQVRYNQPVFFRNSDLALFQNGSDLGEADYSDAKLNYLSSLNTETPTVGPVPRITIYSETNRGPSWTLFSSSADTSTITILSEDLLGDKIILDIAGTGAILSQNYIEESIDSVPSPVIAYNNNYPLVSPTNPSIFIEVDPKNITTDALGTRYEFYEYGTPINQAFPPFIDPSNTSGSVQIDLAVRLNISQHGGFLIDANNSALEFFIEEEEE